MTVNVQRTRAMIIIRVQIGELVIVLEVPH
jgi:hypothetical protein